ncbi:amidohydrolase [Aquimarina brevivitae]|uniref:Omega-amidase YafV n=1 Tax=Aquimarina brevivitae TaxID=323412 RepID=A0A4Q7PKC5_9FLAO|nr:amidohydrolase [Aquimarina brevivitae]RZS99402.1 putative amidohydrolase [Aquimarina brevivitae]
MKLVHLYNHNNGLRMKEKLKIALIQSNLIWENPAANKAHFSDQINSIPKPVDLIILPEMFSTGFTMNAAPVAEQMDGETVSWLIQMAIEKECAITGSIIIEENGSYYNRLLFVQPNGQIQHYDKHQLFTLAKEQDVFTAGQQEVIIDYKGWKIKPQICYDLRFPVWARNTTDYDVLLYVASWPKKRINAWDILLQARAIENMCYAIGVNRVGIDGKGFEYNGHSAVYDVLGNSLIDNLPVENETILLTTLVKKHIIEQRSKLGFLQDRDSFKLLF